MSAVRLLQRLSRPKRSKIWEISTPPVTNTLRSIHAAPAAHAKKQKSKAPREEDSFSDDEDDLFGNSLSSKQRLKVDRSTDKSQPGLAKGSNVTIDPQVQERLLEVERERVHRFNGTYEKLKSLTGAEAKHKNEKPGQKSLLSLVELTKTKEEFHLLMAILRQWRVYPGRSPPLNIQYEIIDCAISNGLAAELIPVLEHHPIYGVSVPDPSRARALMKSLTAPVGSASIDPLSASRSQDEPLLAERRNYALRLADILAAASVRIPSHSSDRGKIITAGREGSKKEGASLRKTTLSPTEDLTSGVILLTAILRALPVMPSDGPLSEGDAPFFLAARQLMKSLMAAEENGIPQVGLSLKEKIWTLAAATETLAFIRGDDWRIATEKQQLGESDDVVAWLTRTISELGSGLPQSSKKWTGKQIKLANRFPGVIPIHGVANLC